MHPSKPKSVALATTLLWICVALGLVTALLDQQRLAEVATPSFINIVLFVCFATIVGVTLLISARKNWARITYAVLFLLGLVPGLSTILKSFATVAVVGMIPLASACLQLAALVLLFLPSANSWFRGEATNTHSDDQIKAEPLATSDSEGAATRAPSLATSARPRAGWQEAWQVWFLLAPFGGLLVLIVYVIVSVR